MLAFRSVVCLFVDVVSLTFVHSAQTAEDIETISFAYDGHVTFPDRVKIWLTSVNPFLPKFWPSQRNTHVDLSVVDIRWQIAAECFETVQWSQWEPIGNHHHSFEWYHRRPPIRPSLPPKRGSPGPTSRRVLPPANMIGDIDKSAVCCVGCHYERSEVAFCQITLALVYNLHSLHCAADRQWCVDHAMLDHGWVCETSLGGRLSSSSWRATEISNLMSLMSRFMAAASCVRRQSLIARGLLGHWPVMSISPERTYLVNYLAANRIDLESI